MRAADPGYDGLAGTQALLAARLLEEAGRLSADGRLAEAGKLLTAAESAGAREADIAQTRAVLAQARSGGAASATVWDVHPDGERFVFVRGDSDGGTGAFSLADRLVITNAVTRGR